jgi:hypothetical protein
MTQELESLRAECIKTAYALAAEEEGAWLAAVDVALHISGPPPGSVLIEEQCESGDRLLEALGAHDRRMTIERLLDCVCALTTSAHERLRMYECVASIRERLVENLLSGAEAAPR